MPQMTLHLDIIKKFFCDARPSLRRFSSISYSGGGSVDISLIL